MATVETTTQNSADINGLWQAYSESRSQDLRNDIVMHYANLVKLIALRMRGTYKNYAQLDDVVNQGIIAMIDAVEKFDSSKGFKFETFATIKVKGAIIDYIRSQDWIPRRLRKLSTDLDETYNKLYTELGRQPTNLEIAKSLNITTEQLDRVMESTYSFNLLSYEEVVWQKMSAMGDEPETESVDDSPEKSLMEHELRRQLGGAIDALNERERTIISLYYYEKLKLKEIADIIGVSESRVCQIHSAAIIKMKSSMKDYLQ